MATIDKGWFFNTLIQRKRSLRGLARYMEIDPSAVSRMFSGERRMQMDEIAKIATFLGVGVAEVLTHAGVTLRPSDVWRGDGGRVMLPHAKVDALEPVFLKSS